jgi:tetratricopeptide (TPR) repeat protein
LPLQARGEFALVKEKLEAALDLPGQPVKRGTMAHKHILYMMLADSAAQMGDQETLKQYASLLEELAVRDGHRPYLAIAHRSWGISHKLDGENVKAEERLAQALALFEELDLRWQTGRTLVAIAELALAQDDEEKARGHYSRAQVLFEALQARPDFERTSAALEAIG